MMPDKQVDDPRIAVPGHSAHDIRPVVEKPRSGLPAWIWFGVMGLAGLLLFGVLNARRQSTLAPAVSLPTADRATSMAPPPLYIPPSEITSETYPQVPAIFDPPPFQAGVIRPQPPQTPYPGYREPAQNPYYAGPPRNLDQQSQTGTPRLESAPVTDGTVEQGSPRSASDAGQVRASRITNHATTVLQGTLVPAVLETGFDSSRPGYARALVQRDIRGFDGSKVLIPRGSRLIGEYGSEAGPAQKRAMIAWTRLIRPDGVTIAIASPVSDPVGRGGVRASVDGHFLERFSGAILQSTLDIGVALASQSAGSPVIVALPGGLQRATSSVSPTNAILPTLTVRPGTSVSVFVARDLDFTDVEQRP